MKTYQISENKGFIGREHEIAQIQEICSQTGSKIIVVYGRRRVGKTELLEQTFGNRNLLKFEGRENIPEQKQMMFVIEQLAMYAEEKILERVSLNDWVEVLKEIASKTKTGKWTIYFEELQWLANHKNRLCHCSKICLG